MSGCQVHPCNAGGHQYKNKGLLDFTFTCSAAAGAEDVPVARYYKGLYYKQDIITIEHYRVIKLPSYLFFS